ncbi:hypothetical protein VBM87_01895 [Mycoplasma sp. 744]|uniref:hypothetical protein n=1 Tax=Mycoplasma sp. 744 TaxID=3108531 RepID=UPI002B1D257F|nr:hypothetical protein [Mycoplasma sp. 744]MEA4115531.1 hypothetical protein [Mycoplasma sp. 744]
MAKIELKTFNYYPDFNNTNLVNKLKKIQEDITYYNVESFEHLSFHELALNFSEYNLGRIKDLTNRILDFNTKDLIIITTKNIIAIWNIIDNFLLQTDLMKDNQIKYYFIDMENANNELFEQFFKIKILLNKKTTKIIYASLEKYNNYALEIINLFINEFQNNFGYYQALNNIFLVVKEDVELQLKYLDVKEENRLIIPSIIHNNFAFFNEITLILSSLKHLNIKEMLTGYSLAANEFTTFEAQQNIAFQLAYINQNLKTQKNTLLMISLESKLEALLKYQTNLKYKNIFNKQILNNLLIPNDLNDVNQYLLNYKDYYVNLFYITKEKFNYRLNDELYLKDLPVKLKENKLSNLNLKIKKSYINSLTTLNNSAFVLIKILGEDEFILGQLIALIYWEQIFNLYLENKDPFIFWGQNE